MNALTTYCDEAKKYEKNLSSDFKKNNGIFYTDDRLVDLIFKEINILDKECKIIDPCCGTGVFLNAAIKKGFINVYGADIDEGAVKICKKHCQKANLLTFDTLANASEILIRKFKIKEKFDVVIGNPPYAPINSQSFINTNDYLFLRNVKNCGDNLFVAAMIRAREMVKDEGIISYIIPKNFLHVNSYSFLRREILRDFSIKSIIDIGSYFKNVRGEQIIITLIKKRPFSNKILIKKLIDSDFKCLFKIEQDFYKDEILLFHSDDDFSIYKKFKSSYMTLDNYCRGHVGRGRSKSDSAIVGKEIRKFGFKNTVVPEIGNQIFIQNIYSTESGIIGCFGGKLEASETVTIFTDGDEKMCRYVLGILHSRLCNFYLHKYCYNNSKLTMHVDAKYLKKIPLIVHQDYFDILLEVVSQLEKNEYMSNVWMDYYEMLNRVVYQIYSINNEEIKFIDNHMRSVQSRKWVKYE